MKLKLDRRDNWYAYTLCKANCDFFQWEIEVTPREMRYIRDAFSRFATAQKMLSRKVTAAETQRDQHLQQNR